jgi:recombination protein RecT
MSDTGRPANAMTIFRNDLQRMESQFAAALSADIGVEKFCRTFMTAVQNNPELLACKRSKLFNAAMRAAQDGLLPDGREGAIVPFGDDGDCSWIPMIAGIRKKARKSGELSDWYAHVVHEGDEFDYQLGDHPHIFHKPTLTGGRSRPIKAAYSIAVFRDGTKSYEIMTIAEIEDVRKRYSRARKGPWSDPIAYPEMVRKTVAKLHAKSLPMSDELVTLMQRDDDLYDVSEPKPKRPVGRPKSANATLQHFGDQHSVKTGETGETSETVETGETIEHDGGMPEPLQPKTAEEYFRFAETVVTKLQGSQEARVWFGSAEQKQLRRKLGISVDDAMAFQREMIDLEE